MNCKFRNAGQTCISSNRILVQENVYDKFASIVTDKVNALSCGDSLTKGTTLGPLINKNGLDKVSRQVKQSLDKGATATTGGSPHEEFNAQGNEYKLNHSINR
jgi:succinate-semialdehyde dehydrogenase/glutarate-semialdehyde dehydrogenase